MANTDKKGKSQPKLEVFFSSKPNPIAIYEYHDSNLNGDITSKKAESRPWYSWGINNLLPQEIFDTVYKNDIKPELIKQSVDLILGNGIMLYKEVVVDGKKTINIVTDPVIEAWLESIEVDEFLTQRTTNLELLANAFTEMIFDGNNQVVGMRNISGTDCRAEYVDQHTGRIMNYYVCGDWRKPRYDKQDPAASNVITVPAYDITNPSGYDKVIHHSKYYMVGQDYYSFPVWWHGTKPWAELSNEISKFQLANLKNGMNIKFHIKIPKRYFDQFDATEIEDKKSQIREQLDTLLAGSDNASKTFISYIESIGGNVVEGWEIVPITYDSKDEAFMKAFDTATRANSRGHGIHPVLSGIDIQGNLGSGSEILNLYNYHVSVKTQRQRVKILEPFYLVKKLNNWDPQIKFGIEYVQLTTVDKNPTGKQSVA